MVKPIEKASICLSLEEAAVRAGSKVLIKVDRILLIVRNRPQEILDKHLRLHPIHIFNIIVI
jgi:hypothetical protein